MANTTTDDVLSAGVDTSDLQNQQAVQQDLIDSIQGEINDLGQIDQGNGGLANVLYKKLKAAKAGLKTLTATVQDTVDMRDADVLQEVYIDALATGSDADILEASQDKLNLLELDKAIGTQLESEQLAQRSIIREQQASAAALQQSQASIQNYMASTGVTNSALQGLMSSAGSANAITQGDLSSDSLRLSESLISNIDYLNNTFDLGGSVNTASQNILQQQANDQANAAQKQQIIGGISSGATIGASFGGPTGAVVGAGVGLLAGIFG